MAKTFIFKWKWRVRMIIYGGPNIFLGFLKEILYNFFPHISYPLFVNYCPGGLSA